MKEKILKLHIEGKSYREIQALLNCSRSLISYYVNPQGKAKNLERQNKNRFRRRSKYKDILGGKCCRCGYDKCIDALHFHHKDPTTKKFTITDAVWGKFGTYSDSEILAEIKKCELVCANCHAEIHAQNDFQHQ